VTEAADRRIAHYLAAIRSAIHSALPSVGDATERRRLELVSQVLCRLIVEARALPALDAQALSEYRALPSRWQVSAAAGFEAARAHVQELLRTGLWDGLDASLGQGVVEIESNYLRRYEEAFQREAKAEGDVTQTSGKASTAPDPIALGNYLSGVFKSNVEVLKLDTLALGYSKLTLLVNLRIDGKSADDLVIRMDRPFNFLETAVVDEFPVLRVLHQKGVPVPFPHALEATGAVLGQPFMVQARVYGRNIGSHFVYPSPNPSLCEKFAVELAGIHSIPLAAFGRGLKGANLTTLAQLTADIGKAYSHWSALQTVSPIIEAAFQWLKVHIADGVGERTLVHGDFSLSNVLIDDNDEVTAILDWEFAGLGNPAADLGWFYVGASRLGNWDLFLRAYAKGGGRLPDARQLDFYVLFGAVRLAVMNYQVGCGFETGKSADLKHAAVAASFLREVTLRVSDRLAALLSHS
jgi:aminoglycoside phosphotransferase (APT) family kinase protein